MYMIYMYMQHTIHAGLTQILYPHIVIKSDISHQFMYRSLLPPVSTDIISMHLFLPGMLHIAIESLERACDRD